MASRRQAFRVPYVDLNNHSTANEWEIISSSKRKRSGKNVFSVEEILAEKKVRECIFINYVFEFTLPIIL